MSESAVGKAAADWRTADPRDGALTYGPSRIDPSFHCATLDGRALEPTPRAFALLTALVAGGGRLPTHGMQFEQVWEPDHSDDLEYLRVAIRALRRKVDADRTRPILIVNVPGVGYRTASG
jgi:two-component system KDP operon response regulator KdpE